MPRRTGQDRTTPWRRLRLALVAMAAAAAVSAGAAPPAGALADQQITTINLQFVPPRLTLVAGDTLTHTNLDAFDHSVESDERGPDGAPLFSSDIIGTGQSDAVDGLDTLAPGTYSFHCAVHPQMSGELRVEDPPAVSVPLVEVAAPTSVAVAGDTLYAASGDEGTVSAFPIEDGGLLGAGSIHASGFEQPRGIAFAPDGTLFVSDSHPSARPGRDRDGRVWAIPPGGGDAAEVGEVVLDELPNGAHATNDLAVRQGRLYVTNGSSTADGAEGGPPDQPTSGTLLSVPLTARGLTPADLEAEPAPGDPPPGLLIEAEGMSNPTDVAFRPGTGEAWMPSTGPTGFAPLGEDLLLRAHISSAAADFGFPACLYQEGPDGPVAGQNPAVSEPCDGTQRRPELTLGLDAAASGVAFGPDGPYWRGDLFVTLTGTQDGGRGHAVVRVPVDTAGVAQAPQVLVEGGDPSDVAFGPEGLYVADLRGGTISLVRPAV